MQRPPNAKVVARLIACSLLLSLPSCGIPPLRNPAPAPDLPPTFQTTIGPQFFPPPATAAPTGPAYLAPQPFGGPLGPIGAAGPNLALQPVAVQAANPACIPLPAVAGANAQSPASRPSWPQPVLPGAGANSLPPTPGFQGAMVPLPSPQAGAPGSFAFAPSPQPGPPMPVSPGSAVQPAAYITAQEPTQPTPPGHMGPEFLPPPGNPGPLGPEYVPPPVSDGGASVENSAQLGVAEFFNDPLLANLVGQALVNNRELMILNEEVEIASNEILARRGAYLPFVNFGGRAELAKPSLFTPRGAVEEQLEYLPGKHFPEPLPNFFGGFTYLWRVDIWRELRNARDAAGERYVAVNERRNFFITRLVADIAENYYDLMALDKRLENLDQTIQLQEKSLEIAKAKKEAGRGTELAVQRFDAEVRKNQSEKLAVFQEVIEAENRINFLLNRLPQPVERVSAHFFDLELHPLRVGIPPELLANRADIREAERELVAAGLDVRVARAHFFPTLDITGAVGYEAFNPKYLFWSPESLIYGVAGDLVGPVINKKAIQAEFLTANAEQLKAMYNYQRVVLNAFTEVVNRVARAENYSRSVAIKRQQLQALQASVDSANFLFQNPREEERVEYLEVLLAQRDLRDGRMGLIDAKREQIIATVNAYQALGGGIFMSNSGPMSP